MKLLELSTGDYVYRYPHTLAVLFNQPRKVLSTSLFHGGYREALTAIFNYQIDCTAAMPRLSDYQEQMRQAAREAGLDPDRVSGMGTAAAMENVAILSESFQQLTVTALATGGVEANGGRVGDPADYFSPGEKRASPPPGTINIILVIDADLPPGILARALVTCTEAKTAALQELMVGSNYSTGLATGSGTDQTMVVANPASPLYLESAGKHSKLGELIGRTVKQAVKEALWRQTRLSPQRQHSILRRMKRFGITEETLWQDYRQEREGAMTRAEFLSCLHRMDQDPWLVTFTSLYLHVLDQFLWNLFCGEEALEAGNQLAALTAVKFCIPVVPVTAPEPEYFISLWEKLLLSILHSKFRDGS
ncbi:adenosylcobinamide amidohydrolase [Candidatus Formimonas warabiya]|uniref:Adenosylcobinamide amidohydrolase n=1 Tax=Formimonas warabiya TaxID=1761012 RepID=A0A3G1KYL9_FORW1|nr:adenosylcobinamide amidohydrolase [Candidatus Formimonas warabiya]ATW27586.1 adenosylcobinamide amidohydrolase [Candidatus Formimonas warabiya]